jgi:hypothetical protein
LTRIGCTPRQVERSAAPAETVGRPAGPIKTVGYRVAQPESTQRAAIPGLAPPHPPLRPLRPSALS